MKLFSYFFGSILIFGFAGCSPQSRDESKELDQATEIKNFQTPDEIKNQEHKPY